MLPRYCYSEDLILSTTHVINSIGADRIKCSVTVGFVLYGEEFEPTVRMWKKRCEEVHFDVPSWEHFTSFFTRYSSYFDDKFFRISATVKSTMWRSISSRNPRKKKLYLRDSPRSRIFNSRPRARIFNLAEDEFNKLKNHISEHIFTSLHHLEKMREFIYIFYIKLRELIRFKAAMRYNHQLLVEYEIIEICNTITEEDIEQIRQETNVARVAELAPAGEDNNDIPTLSSSDACRIFNDLKNYSESTSVLINSGL